MDRRIHITNMGNFFGLPENDNNDDRERREESNGGAGGEKFTCESTPHIRLTVVHMQPLGTGIQQKMQVDPSQLTSDFKKDLSHATNVPKDNISLTWKNEPLQDDLSLWKQGVLPDDILVMKDTRISYE